MDELEHSAENLKALRQVFTCIDNTSLEGTDNRQSIERLCRQSIELADVGKGVGHVASVCVYPVFVAQAVESLKDTGIRVASVAGGFPAGQTSYSSKLAEVKSVCEDGADEIDYVIPRGLMLEGDYEGVYRELHDIRLMINQRTFKVILETGELQTPELITKASEIAIEAGADFLKTSTGKSAISATPEASALMLKVINKHHDLTGRWVGFKAAGGISTPAEALKYYQLVSSILGEEQTKNQFFRIGASRLTHRLFSFLTE